MKKTTVLFIFSAICTLSLSGCSHPKGNEPIGYCHKLRTMINNPNYSRPGPNHSGAVNKSVLLQQYQDLNCE